MIPMTEVTMSRLMGVSSVVEVSSQALHDRSEQQGGEEGQCADQDDHADQQHHERGVVGAHRAEPGRADPLAGERSGDGEREQDRGKAREHHRQAAEHVGERDAVRAEVAGVGLDEAGVAGEGRAVVVGLADR